MSASEPGESGRQPQNDTPPHVEWGIMVIVCLVLGLIVYASLAGG